MTEATKSQVTEKELNAMREIHFTVDLKGWAKGVKKIAYDLPTKLHQTIARGVDATSRKMMTGKGSLLSFPLGIILRNTSRAMYKTVDARRGYKVSEAISVLGAIGGVALATLWAAPVAAAYVGTFAGYVAAGAVATAVVSVPAFTASTFICSAIAGAATLAFSTIISAPANMLLGPGLARAKAAWQGKEVTEEQMEVIQTQFDRESPSVKYERETFSEVTNGLKALPENKREEVYLSLKAEFDAKAAKAQPMPAASTAPSATPKP